MMRTRRGVRGCWAGLIVLAACSQGISIEVRVDPAAPSDRVELFLGLERCGDCSSIRPEGYPFPLAGDVLFRDDVKRLTKEVVDGSAFFIVKPSDLGDYLEGVLAVGLRGPDGQEVQTSAAIVRELDLTDTARWIVHLSPAAEIPPLRPSATAVADGAYVKVWHETQAPLDSCIGFERWTDGQLDDRTFIVPKDDPDCDDLLTGDKKECSPFEHLGAVPPKLADMSCTAIGVPPPTPIDDVCTLGGPTCFDGSGIDLDLCAPSRYCVPQATCSDCANVGDSSALGKCIATLFGGNATGPRLICTIPIQASAPGSNLCPGAESFTASLSATFTSGCQAPQFAALPSTASFGQFSNELTIDNGGHQLTIKAKDPAAGTCDVPFEVSGDPGQSGAMTDLEPSVVELTSGGMGAPKLLLPFELEFVASCNTAPVCRFVSLADSVFNCAGPLRTTVSFPPIVDTYVASSTPDLAFDTSPDLNVRGVPEAVGLMRFDLSSIAGAQVVAARLRLTTLTATNGLTLHTMLEPWEPGATWTKPGPGAMRTWIGDGAFTSASYSQNVTGLVPQTTATPGMHNVSLLLSDVQAWLSSAANFGLVITSAAPDATSVSSSESMQPTDRPRLELTLIGP